MTKAFCTRHSNTYKAFKPADIGLETRQYDRTAPMEDKQTSRIYLVLKSNKFKKMLLTYLNKKNQ